MTTETTTVHDLRFSTDELPHVHLRAHHADVTVHHDAAPGEVTVRVQTSAGFDPEIIDSRTNGREVFVSIPPLLDQNKSGFGFALQLGRLSFGVGGQRIFIEVLLPPEADLDLNLEGGDITVNGSSGQARLQTGGGDIRLESAGSAELVTQGGDINADRIDRAQLRTGGGDIRVTRIGEGAVKTGGGDVRIDSIGSGAVETGGGDVIVERAGGDLAVHTGGGDVRVEQSEGETDVRTGAGDVSVTTLGGNVSIKTGAGDIRVTVPADVPVWQDLHSSFGEVASRIASRGEPAEGQPFIKVTARTGTGDVILAD